MSGRFRRLLLAYVVSLAAVVWTVPAQAQPADWLDDMPNVATVALAVEQLYGSGPEDQSEVGIYTAAALILLRQLLLYQATDDPAMTPERRERLQALEDSYLRAELAIGRRPGARRGALTEPQVQQFYESRRYEKCALPDCYRYWVRFQLEYWNAFAFRSRLLPLLFPCGRAPALIELATRHALKAPLIPFTPAAPLPEDAGALARLEELERRATPAAACTADGTDIDGDGLCFGWEAGLRRARADSAATADECPVLTLDSATTADAESITVRYTTGPGLAGRPIRLAACRAPAATLASCNASPAQAIGTETLTAPEQLAAGTHEATLLEGRVLAPDTSLPYVIVVGEAAGQRSQTYFRKRLMGVVVHGYTFRRLLALASVGEELEDAVRQWLLGDDQVETWQTSMVRSLIGGGCYDAATFAFDWRFDSTLNVDSLLTARARELYGEIVRRASDMIRQHEGDVVDVHFIGHSRGTVVISEALKEWKARPSDPLKGSHVRVTLLDPHPATNDVSPQEDVAPSAFAGAFYSRYRQVQSQVDDPLIELPGGIGIREAEVWFQHSRVRDILAAPVVRDADMPLVGINLWGLGASTDVITPRTDPSIRILWRNLTSFTFDDGAMIDHPGVADYFQAHIDRNAVAGRCVVPLP